MLSFLVAALEGGGTRTDAVVVDDKGRCRGWGRSGPAMALYVGPQASAEHFAEAAERACEGLERESVRAVVVATPRHWAGSAAEALGRFFAQALVLREKEEAVALCGAVGAKRGLIVSAGTGSFAYGADDSGLDEYVGGRGPLLGDEGSGYWIGMTGLRLALHSLDGRQPPTDLLPALLEALGAEDDLDVVRRVYGQGLGRHEVAALSAKVIELAEAGDRVALTVLERAADELHTMAAQLARNLESRGGGWPGEFPFACAGGVMRLSPTLRRRVTERVSASLPQAVPQAARFSPVVGAVLLALQTAGVETDEALCGQLEGTLPDELR